MHKSAPQLAVTVLLATSAHCATAPTPPPTECSKIQEEIIKNFKKLEPGVKPSYYDGKTQTLTIQLSQNTIVKHNKETKTTQFRQEFPNENPVQWFIAPNGVCYQGNTI